MTDALPQWGTHRTLDAAGKRHLVVDQAGPPLEKVADAIALIGDALGEQADVLVVPVARLGPAFFDLRSGFLGEFTQKVVNYGFRLIIVGDVAPSEAASNAFRDYVREANRGGAIRFVPDLESAGLSDR